MWERFANQWPSFNNPADGWNRLKEIHRAVPKIKMRNCPRIFISHRHSDANEALRIAGLAQQQGFEYWLDVIDIPPTLAQGLPASPSNLADTILIAAIIEMALIN